LKISENRNYGNQRNFYTNLRLKWFMNGIQNLLRRADARVSADIICYTYVMHIATL